MWYNYMDRTQPYQRSYRTHNLWLDLYHQNLRMPKINAFHVALLKKMSKSFAGVSSLSSRCFVSLLSTRVRTATFVVLDRRSQSSTLLGSDGIKKQSAKHLIDLDSIVFHFD